MVVQGRIQKGNVLYVFRGLSSEPLTLTRVRELELSNIESDLIATAEIGSGTDIIRTEFIYGGKDGAFMTQHKDMSTKTGFRIMEWLVLWKNKTNDYKGVICVQPGGDPERRTNAHYYQLNPIPKFGDELPLGAELMAQMTVGLLQPSHSFCKTRRL